MPEIALLGHFSNKKLYSALILKAKLLLKLAMHLGPLNENYMTQGKPHTSKPDSAAPLNDIKHSVST